MKNEDLILPKKPSIQEFQKYVDDMVNIRGFSEQSILEICLKFGEEVGELFKAIRKESGLSVDINKSNFGKISHELADVFIYLITIANKFDIDIEEAFREKEEENKKRVWKKNPNRNL